MSPRRGLLLGIVLFSVMSIGATHAAAAPLYDIKTSWGDTNLPPGGVGQFGIQIRNIGDQDGKGPITIKDQLPAGVTVTHIAVPYGTVGGGFLDDEFGCTGAGTETATCVMPEFWVSEFFGKGLALAPSTKQHNGTLGGFGGFQPSGYLPAVFIDVEADPSPLPNPGTNKAIVYGGGGTLPDGSPCAQVEVDLLTLPPCAEDVDQVPFSSTPAQFGILNGSYLSDVFDAAYPFGSPPRQAAGRLFEQRVDFDLNLRTAIGEDGTPFIASHEQLKTAEVTLPRGAIGNPEATPKCDPVDFSRGGSNSSSTGCPANTQVGYINVSINSSEEKYGQFLFFNASEAVAHIPIYNMVPPKGFVADFAFNALLVQAHIYFTLDPAQEYAIKSVTPEASTLVNVHGAEVTIWGVPGDPAHDKMRYYPEFQEATEDVSGAPFTAPIRPLITNPSDCGFDNGGARIRVQSYQHPDEFTPVQEYAEPENVTGCEDPRFRFEPDIALQPTDRHAGAPTGLDVHLEVPQRNDEVKEAKELYAENGFVKGIATPPIKKAVVTFPEGMTLSPSAAQGLGSCSSAQIGLGTDSKVECPDSSQYGRLILHTPVLPSTAQPEGFIYIAKQGDNPFHNFLSLYLVIEEPERGILIKVPGKIDLDPQTGQITTTFDELPQFPVSDMQMTFKGGVRAGLVEPSTCGKKTIDAEFFSWQDPGTAHSVSSSYDITEKPDGSPCVDNLGERQFKPQLEAGTTNNAGGSYSPFTFRLTRTDDDQEFSQLGVTLPQGLAAKFAGVTICSDAAIAQAESRTGAGDGALEQGSPSCPASSLIGTTQVGAGVGVPLTYVPGNVYLAGPYKGAPLSMVVISPAVVGPYDLGVIAVRSALSVDPETAQGSAFTDPFPQVFQGIPVRIRDIRLKLNRPEFTLNPTNCAEKQIDAHVTGTGGDVSTTADDTAADLTNRFQAADCASLGFGPKLSFRLFGGIHRGSHPKLQAVLRMPAGGANISRASVALPHSEFLDQAHIGTVCTRVQFAAHACPARSVYGEAVAQTPLFDQPLSGPVYLRSSSHQLPDMVALLRGPDSQPVEVALDGRIDSVNGGIRNTFELVPDAPVTKFTLTLQGGRKGLLVNSINLCSKTSRATAKFTGQNGKVDVLHPRMRNSCAKAPRRGRHAR